MGGWIDGCIHDPGLNANYRRGRVKKQCVKLHFTVGVNSRALIRDKGLAQFLFPKVGPPFQFAESDAACIDACEWCDEGPGLEFERLSWDEPLTDDQIAGGALVISALHEQDGYPLEFHGGHRLPIGDPFRGFVNHGSLIHQACDMHTDGITADDFARMIEGEEMPGLDAADHNAIIIDAARGTAAAFGAKNVKQLQRWFAALREDAGIAAQDDPDDRPETDEELRELLGLDG